MKAIRLKTEHLFDPVGVDFSAPRLFWNCEGGKKQTKQITVPMSLSFVDALESMLYRHRILRYLAIEDLRSCRRILLRG